MNVLVSDALFEDTLDEAGVGGAAAELLLWRLRRLSVLTLLAWVLGLLSWILRLLLTRVLRLLLVRSALRRGVAARLWSGGRSWRGTVLAGLRPGRRGRSARWGRVLGRVE